MLLRRDRFRFPRTLLAVIPAFFLLFALSACDSDAENAIEDATDSVEDAADDVMDSAEDAADEVVDAVDGK